MADVTHSGETLHGERWEVNVTRGVTFRVYGVAGVAERFEVTVEDGVITHNVPDELSAHEARAFAAMLMEAAYQMEKQG